MKLELLTELLGDSKTPLAHIAKNLKIYRIELGDSPEKDALQRAMFREHL